MSTKILIILGHPDCGSYCRALADAYEKGAQSTGHSVERIAIGELAFDPVLHKGYTEIQPLEPDLLRAQEAISTAEHLVFIYPVWWGGLPALLKGFFDRLFLPGYAFRFDSPAGASWKRLLSKRTARLIVTMDTPPWYYRWVYKMPAHNQMKRTILEFCGIKPVAVTSFGPVKSSSPEQRQQWLGKVADMGRAAR